MASADLEKPMKAIWRRSGLPLRDLAERAATSAATLSFYESGKKVPSLSTLRRVADAAGLDLEVSLVPRLTTADRRTLALPEGLAGVISGDERLAVLQRERAGEQAA